MAKHEDYKLKYMALVMQVHRYRGLVKEHTNRSGALSMKERQEMYTLGRKLDDLTSKAIEESKQPEIF